MELNVAGRGHQTIQPAPVAMSGMTIPQGGRSMLEAGTLPVRDLALLATREGRRPKPVYGTHKWFARRLGSAFRALLVASALPDGEDFWGAFEGGVDLSGRILLDPFVGGGTSVVEAQRLGMTCFGTDVDPVAVAITSFQSRLASLPDLSRELARLSDEVGEQVMPYHRRTDGRIALHHFWVQVVSCGACGHNYDVHPNYLLAEEVDKLTKHVFCRHCGDVHEIPRRWASFSCKGCQGRTTVLEGSVDYGKATCPACRHSERLIQIGERTACPPAFRLFACEVMPDRGAGRPVPMSERSFVKADERDLEAVEIASRHLDRLLGDGGPGLPTRLIPAENRSDDRPIKYGYRRYQDFFNVRQKLHLLLLSRAILKIDGPVREALSIAFSDHLKASCMLASYAVGYRRLSPLFALRAFRHVARPIEINPWVDGTGRGSFPNAVHSVSRAAAAVRQGSEFRLAGGFTNTGDITPGSVDVRVSSASSLLHVDDASIDLVLTDPPYFDNIAYSELSDFFLPWQRHLGLIGGAEDPGFPAEQLAAAARDALCAARFSSRLAACFQKISVKMKPDGIAAFTYQHTTASGWLILAQALATTDLRIVRAFPLAGDTGANLHRAASSICWDAVLITRRVKGAAHSLRAVDADAHARVLKQVNDWQRVLEDIPGVPFREADAANLTRALLLAHSLGTEDRTACEGIDLSEMLIRTCTERGRAAACGSVARPEVVLAQVQ